MEVVAIDKIPKSTEIQDVPIDDLMKVYKTCLDMEIICSKNNGVGLSAVQVGIPWRLFVVKHPDKYRYYIDCNYAPLGDINQKHLQSFEGCLSLRNLDGSNRIFLVERFPKINIKGKMLKADKDLLLEDLDINLEDTNDPYTVIFQHECDHSKNILISSIGKEVDVWKYA